MGGLWGCLHLLTPVSRFLFPIPYTYSSSGFRPMTLNKAHQGHGQKLQNRTMFPPGDQEGLWPTTINAIDPKSWFCMSNGLKAVPLLLAPILPWPWWVVVKVMSWKSWFWSVTLKSMLKLSYKRSMGLNTLLGHLLESYYVNVLAK